MENISLRFLFCFKCRSRTKKICSKKWIPRPKFMVLEREVTKGKTFDDVTKSQRTKTKALEMTLKTSFG